MGIQCNVYDVHHRNCWGHRCTKRTRPAKPSPEGVAVTVLATTPETIVLRPAVLPRPGYPGIRCTLHYMLNTAAAQMPTVWVTNTCHHQNCSAIRQSALEAHPYLQLRATSVVQTIVAQQRWELAGEQRSATAMIHVFLLRLLPETPYEHICANNYSDVCVYHTQALGCCHLPIATAARL
jgi:hypothetical protein